MTKLLLFNAAFLSLLLALSHAVMKWVSVNGSDNYLETLTRYWYLVGFALSIYGFIFLYYLYVLRILPLSMLYPIYTGLSLVLVMMIGHLYFREPLNLAQIIGALLICAGIVLVSWKQPSV